jgi:hypothetical protein
LVAIGFFLCGSVASAQSKSPADEILERYFENRAKFQNLKVTWRSSRRVTDEWMEFELERAARFEARAAELRRDAGMEDEKASDPTEAVAVTVPSANPTENESVRLSTEANAIRHVVGARRIPMAWTSFFYSNGSDALQLRMAQREIAGDSEVTIDQSIAYESMNNITRLPAVLDPYFIVAYRAGGFQLPDHLPPGSVRIWYGFDPSGYTPRFGVLRQTLDPEIGLWFPPFGAVPDRAKSGFSTPRVKRFFGAVSTTAMAEERLRAGRWLHPIDELFLDRALMPKNGQFTMIGEREVDGRVCVVLESRSSEPVDSSDFEPEDWKRNGASFGQTEVTRVFIDPSRGHVPIRAEWERELTVAGKPVAREISRPDRVLEVSEVRTSGEGGYYPASGVIRTYGLGPRDWTAKTLEGVSSAKGEVGEGVLHSEETWALAEMTAGPLATYAVTLAFPERTTVSDEQSNRFFVYGVEQRQPNIVLPWMLSGVLVLGWAIFGCVCLARRLFRERKPRAADGSVASELGFGID